MKKWYLKLDENNVIQDIIDYAYGDYIEVETTQTTLPVGINGGWHKWNGVDFVEDLTLKPIDEKTELDKLKTRTTSMEDAVMMLMDLQMF